MTVSEQIDDLEYQILALRGTPCGACGHEYHNHTGDLDNTSFPPACFNEVPNGSKYGFRRVHCKCHGFVEPVPTLSGFGLPAQQEHTEQETT